MLIVCPSCATSYMIDQASLGLAGRTVRCSRCRATWFAGGPKTTPDTTALADSVMAEAEARSAPRARAKPAPPAAQKTAPAAADDFGAQDAESITATDTKAPPVEPSPPELAAAQAPKPEPEPTKITDAPSLVPPVEHEPLPDTAHDEPDSEEVESFAARRQRLQGRRKKSRRSSRWTAIVLVLIAINVALIGARHEVVRYLPQTASLFAAIGLPVNLRSLKFENVKISMEAQNGSSILVVQGDIVSEADKAIQVPRLRFAARNATGQEVYTWTAPPARSILGLGERLKFRSETPAPPADAKDVMVRFVTAQDTGAK